MYAKTRCVFFLVTFFLAGSPGSLAGSEMGCPQKIAHVEQDWLSAQGVSVLTKMYAELGCPKTEFIAFPGRRGIQSFNHGMVDGEVFRLQVVEPLYTRAFSRSSQPLFELTSSLWLHPTFSRERRPPIGYVLGIVWMEQRMQGQDGKAYHSEADMYEAYNKGHLSGFLATDVSVRNMIAEGKFAVSPKHGKTEHRVPLFHYLGKEFSPFMKKFSAMLKKQPFKHLSSSGK